MLKYQRHLNNFVGLWQGVIRSHFSNNSHPQITSVPCFLGRPILHAFKQSSALKESKTCKEILVLLEAKLVVCQTCMMDQLSENSERLKSLKCFCKKLHYKCLARSKICLCIGFDLKDLYKIDVLQLYSTQFLKDYIVTPPGKCCSSSNQTSFRKA